MGRKRKAASRDKSSSEASSSSSSSGSSDSGGESKQSTAASTARTKRKRPELTPPDTHHVAVPDDNQDLVGGWWWEETGKRKKVMKLYMIQRIVPAQDMSQYPPPTNTTKKDLPYADFIELHPAKARSGSSCSAASYGETSRATRGGRQRRCGWGPRPICIRGRAAAPVSRPGRHPRWGSPGVVSRAGRALAA